MNRRLALGILFLPVFLAACTPTEPEAVMAEPVMEEEAIADCDPIETDGIGGTGCLPETN